MTTKAEFVEEVLTWVDTPFHHMGRLKHIAVDCVGIVVASAANLGIEVTDSKQYPRFPIHGIFNDMVDKQTDPVEFKDVQLGDLLKFKWSNEPQHIAVLTCMNPLQITHAYSQVGMCVTNDLDAYWQRLLTDVRRLRGLA